jgi:Xaa-Pro aminopeptidase
VSQQTDLSERAEKRARLHALLDRHGLEAVVLRSPGNVAWWSGGGRTQVLADQPIGVAAVVVTRDGETIVTNTIEAERMREEELPGLLDDGARVVVLPWDAAPESELPGGDRVADDVPRDGVRDARALLADARRPLTAEEIIRYREVAHDAAIAMTDAANELVPGMTEYSAAALVSAALMERELDPVVLLVAGAPRLPLYRHPLPTMSRLGPVTMLIAGARRQGLWANLTRMVAFGDLDPRLVDAQGRLLRVEAAYFDTLWPGVTVGDVFRSGSAAYGANGFEPDEWRNHHQGGPTGYFPRERLASAHDTSVVVENQAFAWNPSIPSLKVEDTVLVTDRGVEVLTVDPRWPTAEVSGRQRPLVLVR